MSSASGQIYRRGLEKYVNICKLTRQTADGSEGDAGPVAGDEGTGAFRAGALSQQKL